MEATFEVTFPKRQVKALQKIEEFLGVKFTNKEVLMGNSVTISTNSEGFADEIERIKNKLEPLDTVA